MKDLQKSLSLFIANLLLSPYLLIARTLAVWYVSDRLHETHGSDWGRLFWARHRNPQNMARLGSTNFPRVAVCLNLRQCHLRSLRVRQSLDPRLPLVDTRLNVKLFMVSFYLTFDSLHCYIKGATLLKLKLDEFTVNSQANMRNHKGA